ncbi:hypothetical protein ACEUAI_12780 [Aeromonas veronii]|uniref:hypothetical protein n=1 Tax=Aeromonas hydrophila TaxID=644 RepID=UPI002B49096E|nr:hypothetical protein [Aeromonas hydrophila]
MSDEQNAKRLEMLKRSAEISEIINPLPQSAYTTNIMWRSLTEMMRQLGEEYQGLDWSPDFQRGHVWTSEQREHYILNCLRGVVDESNMTIRFNCPNWTAKKSKMSNLPNGLQCIDGLQRATAIIDFMNGKFKVNGLGPDDLRETTFSADSLRIRLVVYKIQMKSDLLKLYIDLNAGGTPHPKEELQRIRTMHNEIISSESSLIADSPDDKKAGSRMKL